MKYPTFGYKKISKELQDLGYSVNKKLVQRVRRDEFLQIPPRMKKRVRRGCSIGYPAKAECSNHVWAWYFVSEQTNNRTIRTFNLIDEYILECHCIYADRSLKSEDVLDWLEDVIQSNGAPAYIRSDNGSEFIAKIVNEYLKDMGIKTLYIDLGSP